MIGNFIRETIRQNIYQFCVDHVVSSVFSFLIFDFLDSRAAFLLALSSFASLSRYESASMLIISERCTSLSISETTQAALGNISRHSVNGLLVVITVDFS